MSWSGDASIGFNTNGQLYYNHYLSLTPNASMVSCVNSHSVWTNMVYQLCKCEECFSSEAIEQHCTYIPLSINIQMVLSFTLLSLDGRLELLGLQYLMDLLKLSISPEDSHSEHLLNALFLYVNMQPLMPIWFHIFTTSENIQVNSNGYLSFGRSVTFSTPYPFPKSQDYTYMVAPFWTKQDARIEGEVSFEVHNASTSDKLLRQVSSYINNNMQNSFSGTWMVVAEWNGVPKNETTRKVRLNNGNFLVCWFMVFLSPQYIRPTHIKDL